MSEIIVKGMPVLFDEQDRHIIEAYTIDFFPQTRSSPYYCKAYKGRKFYSLHRLIMNAPPHLQVDHINGNPRDNRRCNLRLCTQSQNRANVPPKKNKSSKYKGVCYHKKRKKWVAQICLHRKPIYHKLFETEIEAARFYNEKAIEVHGEFAYLNVLEAGLDDGR